jgi:hypothetical protein
MHVLAYLAYVTCVAVGEGDVANWVKPSRGSVKPQASPSPTAPPRALPALLAFRGLYGHSRLARLLILLNVQGSWPVTPFLPSCHICVPQLRFRNQGGEWWSDSFAHRPRPPPLYSSLSSFYSLFLVLKGGLQMSSSTLLPPIHPLPAFPGILAHTCARISD